VGGIHNCRGVKKKKALKKCRTRHRARMKLVGPKGRDHIYALGRPYWEGQKRNPVELHWKLEIKSGKREKS